MIYFDNSATTPLCEGAKNAITEAVAHFGNPSSLHTAGLEAAALVKGAREALYKALLCRREEYEILFTSGGTEANNLALFGAAYAKNRKSPKILVTDGEHPSVSEPCKRLEAQGFKVVRIGTVGGKLNEEQFEAEMDESVVLVSFMTVNNETGAVYPVKRFFEEAKRISPQVLCHTDGVQAFLKVPFGPASTGADLLTVSSHKIHGPKGAGALIVSKDVIKRKALLPQMCGGGQEQGLRSGTENVIGISGFGGAILEKAPHFAENAAKTAALREALVGMLPDEISANAPQHCAPHILSLTLPQIKSETVVHFLSGKGICISAGSACASNGRHKSAALKAYGLSDKQIDSTVRVSLSPDNTEEEAATFVEALREALSSLVRFK